MFVSVPVSVPVPVPVPVSLSLSVFMFWRVSVLLLVLTALAVASQSVTPASTGFHASAVCAAPSYFLVSTRTSQQITPTVPAGF